MIGYIKYKIDKKIFVKKEINEEVLNYIYNNYISYNRKLKIEQAINEEYFKIVISTFYRILSTSINDSEFIFIIDRYIKLLLSYQLEDIKLDNNWIINNIHFLVDASYKTGINGNKYKDLLELIKDALIEINDIKKNDINLIK